MTTRRRMAALGLGAAGAMLIGCGGTPGASSSGTTQATGDIKTGAEAVEAAGDYALVVTDSESFSPRKELLNEVNQRFEQRYPNIKVKRISKAFQDYMPSIKLTLSGDDAPCVAMGDQGRDIDGQLIEAGLLRPLDDYTEAYDWPVDATAQWTEDGAWGEGSNYSVSPFYIVIGAYYNKRVMREIGIEEPPATLEEFESTLAAAKDAGVTPIVFGNADRVGASLQFEALQNQFEDKSKIRDFVFHRGDASFDTPGNVEAAQRLQSWADEGYFIGGFNGLTPEDAIARFVDGEGLYHLTGSWYMGTVADGLGEDAGFLLMPPLETGASPVATGGLGGPWHITSACDQPDVAAAYLDFLISPEVQDLVAASGDLPSRPVEPPADALPVTQDVFEARDALFDDDGVVPFVEVAYPGMADTFYGSLQELLANRTSPEEFVERTQQAYADHFASDR